MGKIFNKGSTEKNKKEGLFKRPKNIEDKNEEQLQIFSKANKTSRLAKNESDYNYDNNKFAFYKFYRDFENFRKGSLGLNRKLEFIKSTQQPLPRQKSVRQVLSIML